MILFPAIHTFADICFHVFRIRPDILKLCILPGRICKISYPFPECIYMGSSRGIQFFANFCNGMVSSHISCSRYLLFLCTCPQDVYKRQLALISSMEYFPDPKIKREENSFPPNVNVSFFIVSSCCLVLVVSTSYFHKRFNSSKINDSGLYRHLLSLSLTEMTLILRWKTG